MVSAAVQMTAGGPLEITEVLVRPPGAGEVRIRMVAAALCHTDVQALYEGVGGYTLPTPVVAGHEGAGVVVEVGQGVTNVQVGQHVILSLTVHDGTCVFCTSGHPALCVRTMQLADPSAGLGPTLSVDSVPVTKFGTLGTFTEEMVVPEECVVVIDEAMPLDLACLIGCAVSTGVGAVRNTAGVGAGDHVVVVGSGGVGLNIIQAAKLAGAAQIIAVDISDDKLQAAKAFGATHLVHADTEDVVEVVRSLTDGLGSHFAFESTGLTPCMTQAVACIRPGGTAVLLGMAGSDAPFVIDNIAEVILTEKKITGSMMGSGIASLDFPQLVSEYLDGSLMLEELVTRRRPLGEINEAIVDLRAGHGLRTVLTF